MLEFFLFFYLTKLYIAISADLNLGNIKQHTPRWALLLSISSVITYRNAAVADLDMNQMPYFLLVSSCSGAEGKKKVHHMFQVPSCDQKFPF